MHSNCETIIICNDIEFRATGTLLVSYLYCFDCKRFYSIHEMFFRPDYESSKPVCNGCSEYYNNACLNDGNYTC